MHSICRSRPPGTLVSPIFSCYSFWYVSEIGYNNNLSKTLQRVWSNMIVVDVSKDNRETSWTQAERANGCQPSTTVYATPSDRSTRYGYECIAVDRVYPSFRLRTWYVRPVCWGFLHRVASTMTSRSRSRSWGRQLSFTVSIVGYALICVLIWTRIFYLRLQFDARI